MRGLAICVVVILFTLCAQAQLSPDNPSELLKSLRHYEIVRITRHASDSQTKHPQISKFHFTAFEKHFSLDLHKNNDLFTPSYREERLDADGNVVRVRTLAEIEHCYYHGHVVGDDTSFVAVSTCRGLEGVIHSNGEVFSIEPAARHFDVTSTTAANMNSHHIFYREADVQHPHPLMCGVQDHLHEVDTTKHLKASAPVGASSRHLLATKYVELLVANDKKWFDLAGPTVESQTAQMISTLAGIYAGTTFSSPVSIALTLQKTFIVADPWTITEDGFGEVDSSELLSKFNVWQANPNNIPTHDNAQLVSGYNFDGNTVGLANVESMCVAPISGGINQKTLSLASTASTITHEMGHNFGMLHDGTLGNLCNPTANTIMSAVSNPGTPATVFSTCSVTYMNSFFADFAVQVACLDNCK